MSIIKPSLPTFVRCADGKFYQDLVYQDFPERRAWFVCFDDKEPAELVVREDSWRELNPKEILKRRGFDLCLKGLMLGRREVHERFFGCDATGNVNKDNAAKAISFFLILKKGVPLPTPNGNDSCVESYPFFPNKPGVYFGDKR